ncbi:hypothetical protein Cni_G24935 [Canna indica]|uniref:MYND-type domain-containing protein n=1 Tax=Canna indica TaxID=4628 RepID=A0AAQ3QNQ6_9LILI|nr:hypothetical protein Cni_G24935 [Canna indica]
MNEIAEARVTARARTRMASQQCLRLQPQVNDGGMKRRRAPRRQGVGADPCGRKRTRTGTDEEEKKKKVDYFDALPDDLVVSVLSKLSSSADRPRDLMSALLTYVSDMDLRFLMRFRVRSSQNRVFPRFRDAGCLAVRAKAWSEAAHKFLKRCVDCGNLEACYLLGMIRFYALENRGSGASLMAKAAIGSNPTALYSLAIIQFNGSGGSKNDKDLRAGVALCARAAFLGHVDALRELGHCLQDGYGVRRNVAEGRRFLVQANARELAAAISSWPAWQEQRRHATAAAVAAASPGCCPLLSDYGWNLPPPEPHPANRFLVEWFGDRGDAAAAAAVPLAEGLRLCSHRGCGRPETRRHEFRRCSVCGMVNYCSRACQALDWKLSHKAECLPTDLAAPDDGGAAAGDDAAVVPMAEVGAGTE